MEVHTVLRQSLKEGDRSMWIQLQAPILSLVILGGIRTLAEVPELSCCCLQSDLDNIPLD